MKKRTKVIALGVTAVLGISFVAGREIGRYNSPNYGTEEAALIYLVTHMRIVSAGDEVKLVVRAGPHFYEYDNASNKVVKTPRPAYELAALPIKSRWRYLEDKRLSE